MRPRAFVYAIRPRHATAALIGFMTALTPSSAYALSLGEVIESVSTSPMACFGVGCATGAIVGGLVATVLGRRERNELCEELEEASAAAQRAELAARRAEARVAGMSTVQATPAPAVVPVPLQQTKEHEPEHSEKESAHKPKTSVRSALLGRLSKDALELPVIERGNVVNAPATKSAMAVAEPRVSKMDGQARARIIDKRIPRFDESLFPDVTEDLKRDMDDFERAMHAMDETIAQEVPEPAQNDMAAYVENLVQEEIERNKSQSARRYSRSRLTVFEGTGELNATKRINRHRPRHMTAISKEA